jgi:DNA mismatch endonuclease (patch repair protein)
VPGPVGSPAEFCVNSRQRHGVTLCPSLGEGRGDLVSASALRTNPGQDVRRCIQRQAAWESHIMDNVPVHTRSRIMAAVRSTGNRSTELALGTILRRAGLTGYRKHWKVKGKPDFAWPGLRVAVFVDGCFWHGCTMCKRRPRSNVQFWTEKIERNCRRDRRVSEYLRRQGWVVIRVRECAVSKQRTLKRIQRAISDRRSLYAVP